MKSIFTVVEYLASNPIWIGLCGGSLIILPIIGIMHIHSKALKDE
jgi:hypothetical protein